LVWVYDNHQPRIVVDDDLKARWKSFSMGFKKTKASDVITEGLSVYEGKDSLSRRAYRNLQRLALDPTIMTPSQMLWVPVMNAGSRNLAARINSIGQMVTGTIRWKNDCLCITIPRHKGDPMGDRVMERHIHANPLDPLSCFIFWLGISLISNPESGTSHFVFGDECAAAHRAEDSRKRTSVKDQAFGAWMARAMRSFTVEDQVRLFEGLAKDHGSHGNRKGALEEMGTCPDGPGFVCVMNRSGHKLPGQAPKYIYQMQRGGDEFCSRVCAGLDIQDNNFGILPPHFREDIVNTIPWHEFVWNYNKMDPNYRSVVPYCVASVVYHYKTGWIRENIPATHPLWGSQFIVHKYHVRLGKEEDLVVGHLLCSDCGMRATGIPAQVRLGYEIAGIAEQQQRQMELLKELLGNGSRPLSDVVSEEIKAHLQEDSASIREKLLSTFEDIKVSINQGFQRLESTGVVGARDPSHTHSLTPFPPTPEPQVLPSPTYVHDDGHEREPEWMYEEEEDRSNAQQLAAFNIHWWTKDGDTQQRLHPIPFPIAIVGKMPVANLWALWHRRTENAMFPPYKLLSIYDISSLTEKNYCKAKSVCEVIYEHLRRLNALPRAKVLSDCSLEELKMQCEVGVKAIIEGHNVWLKKRWEQSDARSREPFKPFKARKLSNIAYTTLHKYLHRRCDAVEGEDSDSHDGSV